MKSLIRLLYCLFLILIITEKEVVCAVYEPLERAWLLCSKRREELKKVDQIIDELEMVLPQENTRENQQKLERARAHGKKAIFLLNKADNFYIRCYEQRKEELERRVYIFKIEDEKSYKAIENETKRLEKIKNKFWDKDLNLYKLNKAHMDLQNKYLAQLMRDKEYDQTYIILNFSSIMKELEDKHSDYKQALKEYGSYVKKYAPSEEGVKRAVKKIDTISVRYKQAVDQLKAFIQKYDFEKVLFVGDIHKMG